MIGKRGGGGQFDPTLQKQGEFIPGDLFRGDLFRGDLIRFRRIHKATLCWWESSLIASLTLTVSSQKQVLIH